VVKLCVFLPLPLRRTKDARGGSPPNFLAARKKREISYFSKPPRMKRKEAHTTGERFKGRGTMIRERTRRAGKLWGGSPPEKGRGKRHYSIVGGHEILLAPAGVHKRRRKELRLRRIESRKPLPMERETYRFPREWEELGSLTTPRESPSSSWLWRNSIVFFRLRGSGPQGPGKRILELRTYLMGEKMEK